MPAARIQPQGRVRINRSGATQGLSASFALNRSFNAATPSGKTGSPVISSGPTWGIGPNGYFAQGNGTGKVVTSLYASDIGISGNSPRTILTEFSVSDISEGNATLWSIGGTGVDRADFSLLRTTYRTIKLNMWGGDAEFALYGGDGVTARVFLAITYAGGSSIRLRSIAKLSTGAVVTQDQTTTLAGSLITPDTTPLTLLGGGTGGFMTSTRESLSRLDIFGGRVLSDAEIDAAYRNRWQLYEGQAPMLYAAAGGTNATATPSGVSASSAVGSILAAGQGRVSPAGVSAAASVGSVIASGQGAALPAGVSAAASIGTVSATGATVINATASPAAVSAAAAVGSPAASGAASSAATGVSAVASVGTVSASGATVINGSASAAGVSVASAVGAPAASGTASAAPAGVTASASVGSVSASGATVVHGNAAAGGVAASSAVGSVAANGTARATPSGVQAAAAVGSVSANGGVSVAGNAQPAGVAAIASVGTPSASGATVVHGNASAAGVSAAASVGSATVSASARATPAGVSVLATIGQPIASGQIQMNGTALPAGVVAYTYVGQVTAGSMTFARAPAGPGYSRPFTNTTRPHQVNTRRTR